MRPASSQTTGGRAGMMASDPGHESSKMGGTSPSSSDVGGPEAAAEPTTKLAMELSQFNSIAANLRSDFTPAESFEARCQQAFDIANDLFGNAPTWVCFYRELMGGNGFIQRLFTDKDDKDNEDFSRFLRSEQYHQIQLMLTALRGRDLPENDPNDPQRMITVRLPKSLHEAMCEEAGRLNISVNRLCISRMLQLLDPKMIPKTTSKPRGRKPRTRGNSAAGSATAEGLGGLGGSESREPSQTAQPGQLPASDTSSHRMPSGMTPGQAPRTPFGS